MGTPQWGPPSNYCCLEFLSPFVSLSSIQLLSKALKVGRVKLPWRLMKTGQPGLPHADGGGVTLGDWHVVGQASHNIPKAWISPHGSFAWNPSVTPPGIGRKQSPEVGSEAPLWGPSPSSWLPVPLHHLPPTTPAMLPWPLPFLAGLCLHSPSSFTTVAELKCLFCQ